MTPGTPVGLLLDDALASYGPMSLLVNEAMREAQPVDRLGQILFPDVERELADRATSALYAQPQATCGCGARVFEF